MIKQKGCEVKIRMYLKKTLKIRQFIEDDILDLIVLEKDRCAVLYKFCYLVIDVSTNRLLFLDKIQSSRKKPKLYPTSQGFCIQTSQIYKFVEIEGEQFKLKSQSKLTTQNFQSQYFLRTGELKFFSAKQEDEIVQQHQNNQVVLIDQSKWRSFRFQDKFIFLNSQSKERFQVQFPFFDKPQSICKLSQKDFIVSRRLQNNQSLWRINFKTQQKLIELLNLPSLTQCQIHSFDTTKKLLFFSNKICTYIYDYEDQKIILQHASCGESHAIKRLSRDFLSFVGVQKDDIVFYKGTSSHDRLLKHLLDHSGITQTYQGDTLLRKMMRLM